MYVLQAVFFNPIAEFINPKKCPLYVEDLNEGVFDPGALSPLQGTAFI